MGDMGNILDTLAETGSSTRCRESVGASDSYRPGGGNRGSTAMAKNLATRDAQYTPHASTWLNGARWEDEMPDQWIVQNGAQHASHVIAKPPEAGKREPMPDHVRAAIAKLRKP